MPSTFYDGETPFQHGSPKPPQSGGPNGTGRNVIRNIRWPLAAIILASLATLAAFAIASARGNDGGELGKIRSATAKFHSIPLAQSEGWDLREGLDSCFENPGVGAMGFHYINLESLNDLTEDPLRPEALVYAPGPNGQLTLGAIEYIVPAEPWDAAGNTMPPMLLGQHFHLNPTLGVYILHVWLFKENPRGIYEDWNPKVSCPHWPDAGTAGN